MPNKLTEFQSFVYSSDYDIIALTETWLSDCIFDNEILPTGYNIYRADQATRVIKQSISSHLLSIPNNLEAILVQVFTRHLIILCLIYNPPNASDKYHQQLLEFLHSLSSYSCSVILMDDFNIPDVNWSTLTESNHFSNQFCDANFDLNLTQIIDLPIHVHGNILDLVKPGARLVS